MKVMALMIVTQENIVLISQLQWKIVFYHDGWYQLMNADDDNDDENNDDNDDNDNTDKNDNEDDNKDDLTIG